jgi:UDP-N-acetylglucosamine:LPS N-acetylglucosamine transferase
VVNFGEALWILLRERPQVVISAGAGCIVPFAIIGRLLGVRIIYIETASAVTRPSVTGRIMYYLATVFLYQWAPLGRYWPRGIYAGLIYGTGNGWQS